MLSLVSMNNPINLAALLCSAADGEWRMGSASRPFPHNPKVLRLSLCHYLPGGIMLCIGPR